MQSENVYIGDDKFQRFLDHYNCPAPLGVVKLRFAGAVCSPNPNLRPTDVIASLFAENLQPRLTTKNEAELFFKFFMGLWDEVFQKVRENKIKLEPVKLSGREQIREACAARFAEVEGGYVEGFWGGGKAFKLPAFIAQMIDSLTELSGVYNTLAKKLDKAENLEEISNTFRYTDKMVEKAVSFIIENSVLPRIDSLQRVVH